MNEWSPYRRYLISEAYQQGRERGPDAAMNLKCVGSTGVTGRGQDWMCVIAFVRSDVY